MAMTNPDLAAEQRTEILQRMTDAVTAGDTDAFIKAFEDLQLMVQNAVMQEARGLIGERDSLVLTQRGARQLTSEETTYYERLADAMRSSNPQQALTDLAVVMPTSTIDLVFEDLVQNHPLLDTINFQNTSGLTEMVVNTADKQLATWGTLTSTIATELTSGFEKITLGLNKLSAFIPVAKSMLDLGPVWLDRYVRLILAEALAFGLEEAIINGTGKDQPIGMNRQVGEGVTVTGGVYPLKTTVPLTSFAPEQYGAFLAPIATTPHGGTRPLNGVILVCNPTDYLTKVMPATTLLCPDGMYARDVFPVPTRVIQSVQVPSGKAIVGLPHKYFMGIGTAKNGKLEYSDDYKFLEDERTYLIRLYGHGQPLDNNAFVYADISGLEPLVLSVDIGTVDEIKGVVKTEEQA